MKITKETTIGDVVDNFDGAKEILSGFGMHCFGCPMSRMETLEEASSVHGVDVEEILAKLAEGATEYSEEDKERKQKIAEFDYDDSDFNDGEE